MMKLLFLICRLIIYISLFYVFTNPEIIVYNKFVTFVLGYLSLFVPFLYIYRNNRLLRGFFFYIFAWVVFYQFYTNFQISSFTIAAISIAIAFIWDSIETIKRYWFELEWIELTNERISTTIQTWDSDIGELKNPLEELDGERTSDDELLDMFKDEFASNQDWESQFFEQEEQMNPENWDWKSIWVNPKNVINSDGYVLDFEAYKEVVEGIKTAF